MAETDSPFVPRNSKARGAAGRERRQMRKTEIPPGGTVADGNHSHQTASGSSGVAGDAIFTPATEMLGGGGGGRRRSRLSAKASAQTILRGESLRTKNSATGKSSDTERYWTQTESALDIPAEDVEELDARSLEQPT